MSLDYVKKGEAVRASTVNSIIDAIGGNQSMSPDLNVTTTARGPKVSMPYKFGGPNSPLKHYLDTGKYVLSGATFTRIVLGPTFDDCLGVFRYHTVEGNVVNPISAAVVFKNSDECPTGGQLDGYLLSEDDFGKDAEAHSVGYVETKIEDDNGKTPTRAELWSWKLPDGMAAVFTNVSNELSVKSQLSSILEDNGMSGSELSSLKRVGSWKLTSATSLSAEGDNGEAWFDTHELVNTHDVIDVYQSEFKDYNVVLKCSLKCVGVQESDPDPQTGETHVESTKWAWSIPLGPDASSNDGKAHSSCVTYGGNPVLFEVEEGEVGDDYDGSATYYNGEITFGLFQAQAGSPIDPGELWLVLKYDYEKKAVMGEFSHQTDSGSYTQDGILSRNVFVISGDKFTPSTDETQVGTKAPIDILTYGTWGVLPKDGPKLDTYCKKDAETEFKSLDWADGEGEDVECQCAEIYKFDQLDFTASPLSTDHIIVRRPDENGGGAEVKYIPLSSLEISGMYVPPDADVSEAQTSSLQTRELDDGSNVEELFQFHLSDTVDLRLSDLTSVDIVIRNPNDGQPYVEYGKLCIDITPDAQGQTGQESIDWLSGTNELQLYKFDEAGMSAFEPDVPVIGNREYLLPNEYEFVLRKNGAGGEVTYGQVALSVKMEELSGDSQVGDQKSINISSNTIELYNMGEAGKEVSSEVAIHFDEPQSILSDDWEFVIRKGGSGGEIDYTTVKLRQAKLSVDSDGTQKSVQYNPTTNQLQLYKMHENGEAGNSVTITSAMTSLLPSNYELVVRKGGAGGQIEYTKLSAALSGAIELDTQATSQQKSLEWKTENNRTYAQLYKMDAAGEPTEQVDLRNAKNSYQDLLPDDEEFVIRSAQGGEIKYKNVGVLLSAYSGGGGGSPDLSVDSEIPALQHSSLQHVVQGGNDYYELYGFHDSTNTQTSLSGYEYVVRHNDGNGNVSVKYLSADLAQASCPASFDYYTRPDGTHWLRGGYFQRARSFYWVSSTEITVPGMVLLSVSMGYSSTTGIIQGASSLPSPTVSAMYIPLWNIGQDMKPTWDYRHAPMLPRWE